MLAGAEASMGAIKRRGTDVYFIGGLSPQGPSLVAPLLHWPALFDLQQLSMGRFYRSGCQPTPSPVVGSRQWPYGNPGRDTGLVLILHIE